MSPTLMAVTAIAVAAGGLLQGSIGVGFALVMSPLLAIVAPSLLPGCVLILMLPLNAYVAWREWPHIDWPGTRRITLGRCLGAVAGLALLAALSVGALRVFVGVATLLAAGASLLVGSFTPGRVGFGLAGLITGVTETATGIGGPPLALVYQNHAGPVLRSTLAMCFLIGQLVSLALLALTARLTFAQIEASVLLLPARLFGALLSRLLHGRLDGRPLRIAMLVFAMVSGLVCFV